MINILFCFFVQIRKKISNFATIMTTKDILSIQQSYDIVGKSPSLLSAINVAVQAAPYDVSVLICGENGTGKEVFHKIIHNNSPRRYKKCIAVNCGGLPEGTIDSELFGHIKGAFTGALSDRKGYFEEADGGTIFLDEIGELPLSTQAKLLRVIESGEYYRMGSTEVHKTNVRIVAATNVNLLEAINKGKFREDLYYRLSTIIVNVPALRDRQEDIYLLFLKFASDVANKYKMPPIQLEENAKRLLVAYSWPGNVRDLLHLVDRISIIEQERLITVEILRKYLPEFNTGMSIHDNRNTNGGGFAPGEKEFLYNLVFTMKNQLEEIQTKLGIVNDSPQKSFSGLALPAAQEEVIDMESEEVSSDYPEEMIRKTEENANVVVRRLDEIEKEAIKNALDRNKGNRRKAAEELGISERTIHRKIQDYNL